jgi:hypothetical protein
MNKLTDLQTQLGDLHVKKLAAERLLAEGKAKRKRGGATDAELSRLTQDRDAAVTAEAGVLGQLAQLGDPRKLIEHLDDGVPFVLFPLRVETRFVTSGLGRPKHELLVRVYPDDCQVQTFTDFISDSELANVRRFWTGFWKAGGVVGQQRAAWRGLVASHGSGRAVYLVGRYRPIGSAPVKSEPHDVILVVTPTVTLDARQRAAAVAFWISYWRAGKDVMARTAAHQALLAAVGAEVVERITTGWRPANVADEPQAPHTRADVTVSVTEIELPPDATIVTAPTSWQQAPRALTLPNRFVVTGVKDNAVVFSEMGAPVPATLHVGPDPSLPDSEQIKSVDGELRMNKELRWLTDFDEAVARGMGLRITLTPAQYAAGFDRLTVLGLRLSSNAEQGAQLIEALLRDHHASKSGFAVIPQGAPTNNTDEVDSAYSWLDDPETSFDQVFGAANEFALSNDPLAKTDGQVLAEILGIDVDVLRSVAHANGTDQADAHAMNTLLWPTTWGYFLEAMLATEIDDATIERVRRFFLRYVSGRGAAPAIRIGKQPYGILPAVRHTILDLDPKTKVPLGPPAPTRPQAGPVVGRIHPSPIGIAAAPIGPMTPLLVTEWPLSFLAGLQTRLDALFQALDAERGFSWHVGQRVDDPQQLVLNILGLHPSSVEYFYRFLQSMDEFELTLANRLNDAHTISLYELVIGQVKAARNEIAESIGLDADSKAPMLDKILSDEAVPLTGPVIDDVPLSETAPIRAYAKDGKNYLAWLEGSLYQTIYKEDFGGNPRPKALLYLLARHAVMLSYWDASVRLLSAKNLIDPVKERREANFINVGAAVDGVSKFEHLIAPRVEVTGEPNTTIAEYLDRPPVLKNTAAAARLKDVKTALAHLAQVSTAKLERAFAEHVDLCSYRLDAWRLGLVHHRLHQVRGKHARGAYLGAFAILENVRSENKLLTPKDVPSNLASTFEGRGRLPIMRDPTNGGYIHAPSINHATTAAVLRNAYMTHATPSDPGLMSINLSSARVRVAIGVLEGIRNGQGLAELLGYQFERGLHDAHNLTGVQVEQFLFALRGKFPLTANKHAYTKVIAGSEPLATIKHVQARNVIDGLALIERARQPNNGSYPFGFPLGDGPDKLPLANAAQRDAINAEVTRLRDTNDAVADLMLAESVHQVVQGQTERAAAAIDVIGKGRRPHESEPDVARTPRSGLALVHRVTLHLDSAATAPPGATPRANAEPALEAWLASRMPPPTEVACLVTWSDPSRSEQTITITQAQLGLRALDLLHMLPLDAQQGIGELDDRIEQRVRTMVASHPAIAIAIRYTEPVPGKVSMFELAALVRPLRTLVLGARSLSARDALRGIDAPTGPDASRWDAAELATRVELVAQQLQQHVAPLAALAADTTTPLDAYVAQAASAWLAAGLHGIGGTGTGAPRGRIRALHDQIAAKLRAVIARWEECALEVDALLATLPDLPDDTVRLRALVRAERMLSTTDSDPQPDTVAAYQAIMSDKRAAFAAALAALRTPLTAQVAGITEYFALVDAALPAIAAHDPVWFDLEREANDIAPEHAALATLRIDVANRLGSVAADIGKRVAAAAALIAQARATTETSAAVKLATDAARKVLGDSARVLPHFTLAPDAGDELASAYAARTTLLADLVAGGRAFPIDDWLYGIARVREPMAQWERSASIAEAFGQSPAELVPLQLPFLDDDRWTALELPDGYKLDGEKLLYTAHFATPFDNTRVQCGLVLDEWTEVVPGAEEVTGVAFHFDQPNTEPAQTILVVVPPFFTGAWRWNDLHAALHETLEEAKLRAIEPEVVYGQFGHFLPAALVAVTKNLVTMAIDLSDNNP